MIHVHRLRGKQVENLEGVAGVAMPRGDERTWFLVVAPTPEEQQVLVRELPLHELSMEDALKEGHPPKLADFDDHVFFIVHSPQPSEEGTTRKVAVFLGKTWIVSVVRSALPCAEEVEQRVLREPERFLAAPERLAHALIDQTVDAFEGRVDEYVDRTDDLETLAVESPQPEVLVELLDVRREVTSLLRTVRSQRDVCLALSRSNHAVLSRKITPYLRDVYDHTLRVYDLLEGVRDTLGVARDAYLSAQNNRLSETMRVLTVIATIMMPLGVVAGVFGMNFDAIPGMHHPLGFWLTVVAMVGLSFAMLSWFRRRHWV